MRKDLKIEIIRKFDSQTNFAKIVGKTDNWVSRIVRDRQQPTPQEKDLIAKTLQLKDIDSFLEED